EQEHAWEPKGAAQLMDVKGGLHADGTVAGYDFATRYPSNGAPILALLLTRAVAPVPPPVFDMGDRTAIPPYKCENIRVVAHDMPPIVRASWLRGVSALPNTFAHESYIDELATEAGVDPIEYRLRYLRDPRGIDLVNAVAERAGWTPRPRRQEPVAEGDILRGRGFAYALYLHSKFPGYGAAWSAWVADVGGDQIEAHSAVAIPPPNRRASTYNSQNPFAKRRGAVATVAALCTAVIGIAAATLPWRSIAPIAQPDASLYSAATIARGRQLAGL